MVELGKGSWTNARLPPPFGIRPRFRPQFDVRNVCAAALSRVEVGKGRAVLVLSEYAEARDGPGSLVAARTPSSAKAARKREAKSKYVFIKAIGNE
jgi:hypothetical protein